ncbi:hypothetical protein ACIBCD_31070 [Nocardia brasiliensis]|uniref:hypothetical protein n=1 Tax=Nocardia brasiliensis TaxID=37326 RepID=UPI00378A82B0
MTHAHMDRRLAQLAARVADIEDTHSESLYRLSRSAACCRIETGRLIAHADSVGRAFTLIMERLGIPPTEFPPVACATEDDIDATLDADC